MSHRSDTWVWGKIYGTKYYAMLHIESSTTALGVVDDFGNIVIVG